MKNVILLIVAIVLAVVLVPLGAVFTLARAGLSLNLGKALRYLADACGATALGIDHLGNTICRDLFNSLFIKRGGYHFGNIRETISSALGKNEIMGTLTHAGRALVWILDTIDPGHCRNAIQSI